MPHDHLMQSHTKRNKGNQPKRNRTGAEPPISGEKKGEATDQAHEEQGKNKNQEQEGNKDNHCEEIGHCRLQPHKHLEKAIAACSRVA